MLVKQYNFSIPFLPEHFHYNSLLILVGFMVFVVTVPPAQAQNTNNPDELDEVVVTATRNPVSESLTGSAVTVISREEIEQQQAVRVPELLRSVSGVSVDREGSLGGKTSVRMRGLDSKYTQVLVNGVRVNDPTSPDGAYDFSTITTDHVQRIEVVRGNQSVLHGSDAIGGVINIITNQGEGDPEVQARVENGSFGTRRVSAQYGGAWEEYQFSTSLSRYETDGISAADEDAGNTEKDGYENRTFSTRLSFPVASFLRFESSLRLTEALTETDGLMISPPFAPTDADNSQEINENVGHVRLETTDSENPLQQHLQYSWFDNERLETSNDYAGDRSRAQYGLAYDLNSDGTFSLDAEYQDEHAQISSGLDTGFWTSSVAGEYQWTPGENWSHTVGVRHLDHEEFGRETTYRVTSAYFTDLLADVLGGDRTKLRGNYGTGFNAPTSYQLYNNQSFALGNPNLDPETSEGWELGLEHYVTDSNSLSLAYFRNEIEDQFGFRNMNPPGEPDYFNREGTTETDGIESALHVEPSERITVDLTYTYQQSEDPSGNDIDLIPENKASATVNWRYNDSLRFNVNGEYNDERPDGTVTLDDYRLLNAGARYSVSEDATAYARLENAFDEDYQEVDGYGTAGRALYGGMKMTF